MPRKNGTRSSQSPQAVIYARVSTKEQEKEGFSIDAQLKLLRDYASANGYAVLQEYVDVETAKRAGRTNFTEMVGFFKKMKKSKAGAEMRRVILVEKTDRLYRNLKDWVTLDDLDLELHLVKEKMRLSPADSRSSEKLHAWHQGVDGEKLHRQLVGGSQKGNARKGGAGAIPESSPTGLS